MIDAARCNAHATAGCGGPLATIPAGGAPIGVAVDPVTDTLYVGDVDATVAVIDGRACNRANTSGCATAPTRPAAGGIYPTVDPDTRTLYVPGVGAAAPPSP